MTDDPIYRRFMEAQLEEGLALASESELLRLYPTPQAPPSFVAEFRCNGVVRDHAGVVRESRLFRVGIWFPPDYLRRVDPFQVLRLFEPENAWHPNIRDAFICIGRLVPGTPLVDILYQVFEVLSYRKFNPREDDCLNRLACAWAREHQQEFPTDPRPLKRRVLNLEVAQR